VKPAVTVLIDTYNHERFIEEAIVSVLEQDFPRSDLEVVVVDDGSTDRTAELVAKFEPRVRLIRKANGGQASAFNAGIPESHGEIISFLDGDDWWKKHKLSAVVEAIDTEPSVGMVGNGIIMAHLNGRQQWETLRAGLRFQANTLEGARVFRKRKSFLGTSRMTIRTEVLRRIGPVPEALMVQADEYLFTLAAVLAEAKILPEALTYYRLHDSNRFQISNSDPATMRHKFVALAALAQALARELRDRRVDSRVSKAIVEIVQAESDCCRLMVDGGWPWETVRAEWAYYAVTCSDAPISHRLFKALSLLPALAAPPKFYYRARRQVSQNWIFLRARNRWFPVPEPKHVDRRSRVGL
jgi:glycosyltransferase involved in cell wall biosynthesis